MLKLLGTHGQEAEGKKIPFFIRVERVREKKLFVSFI